jgi:hypothetical protein
VRGGRVGALHSVRRTEIDGGFRSELNRPIRIDKAEKLKNDLVIAYFGGN